MQMTVPSFSNAAVLTFRSIGGFIGLSVDVAGDEHSIFVRNRSDPPREEASSFQLLPHAASEHAYAYPVVLRTLQTASRTEVKCEITQEPHARSGERLFVLHSLLSEHAADILLSERQGKAFTLTFRITNHMSHELKELTASIPASRTLLARLAIRMLSKRLTSDQAKSVLNEHASALMRDRHDFRQKPKHGPTLTFRVPQSEKKILQEITQMLCLNASDSIKIALILLLKRFRESRNTR